VNRARLAARVPSVSWPPLVVGKDVTGPRNVAASSSQQMAVMAPTPVGASLTRYGVLWPILTSFTLLVLALPILLQRRVRKP
jgi:hypothetical protein